MLGNLATAFGVIMAMSPVFQLWQFKHRKTSDDVSIHAPLVVLSGSIVWILYGAYIHSDPAIVTNLVTAGMQVVMIALTLKLRSSKRRKTDCPIEAVGHAQSHLSNQNEQWGENPLCETRTSELLWALNYLGWELKPKAADEDVAQPVQAKA